jgi:hypothetical protein
VLERATDASFTDRVEVYRGPATNYEAASAGIATYHYRVKAHNAVGESEWSNAQTVEVRWELEPNGESQDALRTGAMQPGIFYYGVLMAADLRGNDYFYFDLSAARKVELWLTNMAPGQDFNLVLRDASEVRQGFSGQLGNADEHILTAQPLPAGRYYVQVSRAAGDSVQPYHLRVVW